MAYKDEEILKMKKKILQSRKKETNKKNVDKELQESIYDEEVHILGVKTVFKRKMIDDVPVSIYMPEEYFRFPQELVELIYPGPNAPAYVYGGTDISMQYTFELLDVKIKEEEMKDFVKFTSKGLAAVGPGVSVAEKTVESQMLTDQDEYQVGRISFVSKALDVNVYNVQFYISYKGKLLFGALTFPGKHKKRMLPLAMEVIKSLRIEEIMQAIA